MGMRRDASIREWQERAWIEPAHGRRAATLERMSQLAFDLIKVIELERSGTRDGDRLWGGSDPVAGLVQQLHQAEAADLQAWGERDHDADDTPGDDLPF